MRCRLIAAGTRLPEWVGDGFRDYQRRLRRPLALELVEIPTALRDTVRPGVANLSFATRDVEGALAAFADQGLAVRGPFDFDNIGGGTSTFAHVVAGGVPFEVIRYGA